MYRRPNGQLEVFLVHPGGPFWAARDRGAWSIPKGEYLDDEFALAAAQREFAEETGFIATGKFVELGQVRQLSGKVVTAWGFEGDCDPSALVSNRCMVEWPPRSGRRIEVPEVDRGAWFSVSEACQRILKSQEPFITRLALALEPKATSEMSASSS